MAGERTEKASPQKRKKAVDQGDRLISRELNTAAAMLAGVFALRAMSAVWARAWKEGFHSSMSLVRTVSANHLTSSEISVICRSIVLHTLSPLLLFAAATLTAAISVGALQGGGQVSFAAVSPKWSRLNPMTNAKHLLGGQALVRLGKSMVPAACIGILVAHKISNQRMYPTKDLREVPQLFKNVYDLLQATAVAMALWSAIDYVNTWRTRESRLKMTKQDVRDEMKESEGSPQIKRRIRQIQRQFRKRQLRADVRKATVVLTNPTHYAVALSFDFVAMDPPKVLAKGRNLIALQIREEAQWAGIPIIENPPLARSLYRGVEPGQTIPMELYAAVAAILAFLYRKEVEDRMRQKTTANAREG
jgi:flagellar biosynthetic protein FlhB